MPYRFKRNENLARGLHRIAAEQLDDMLAELDDQSMTVDEQIHSARKHGKKIRGLLRLVRPGLRGSTYRRENAAVRDASRLLSAARDCQILIAAFDRLFQNLEGDSDQHANHQPNFAAIRPRLLQRREALVGDSSMQARLAEFRDRIVAIRDRVGQWRVKGNGPAVVCRGFKRTYAAAQAALKQACDDGAPEAFHEWRRRVKDHWCHLLLLEQLWPPVVASHSGRLDQLAGLLGEDHDLAILTESLPSAHEFGDAASIESVIELAAQRQEQLRSKAKKLGAEFFQPKPKQITRPIAILWPS